MAVHPHLYEATLSGARVMCRLRTALATWRLARTYKPQFRGPALVKYPGLLTYMLFGIICRSTPEGADLVFTQEINRSGDTA
jgi:hypothetical protein